jgi:phage tail sheath protein FI
MPEYLAPGVYVEEVSYRTRSIEGVSTSTTGFIGPTRYGPIEEDLEVLTSLLDFERMYGDRKPLLFAATDGTQVPMANYMWHAARAYFENGGARLYVKRIFTPGEDSGLATAVLRGADEGLGTLTAKARFPGAAGGRRLQFTLQASADVLVVASAGPRLVGALDRDIVVVQPRATGGSASYGPSTPVSDSASGSAAAPAPPRLYSARLIGNTWELHGAPTGAMPSPPDPLRLADLHDSSVRIVTVTVTDYPPDPDSALPTTWTGLPIDPLHERAGQPDSVFALFNERPANRAMALRLPVVLSPDRGADGIEIARLLVESHLGLLDAVLNPDASPDDRSFTLELTDGNDGARPTADAYDGTFTGTDAKLGLIAFEDIDDMSIVAAPGSTFGYEDSAGSQRQVSAVQQSLIGHCSRMRYRIAVLDSGDAAMYYPWVTVVDPVTQGELQLPPSGFVCGIYARNDIQRAVYKAPANEVVTLAVGFEKMINKGQQDVLNPQGVNCFRYFPGAGMRLWGARTATSDPEWKYVNLRRYFAYLEHSIDRGTQWAVFEPNGERLWANVRRTIADFLFNEWQMGALLGDKPEKAFFVKCDRTTMTQNDLDNGRLVCLIGVAPLRPAEYVIFRIGQWTADRAA